VVVGGRDGLEDARVLVGNLALRMPVAPPAAGAGVHPSTSPCYYKIRLGKMPAQTVPAPLVVCGAGAGLRCARRCFPLVQGGPGVAQREAVALLVARGGMPEGGGLRGPEGEHVRREL
jgi:hypothetical protein